MKHFKRFAAVLLALTLLLSACSGGDTSWAFRSGDAQVSSGLYMLYQITAFGEAEQKYAESTPDYAGMKASDFLRQTIDGKVASDWIQDRAAELCAEHLAVLQKFTSLGLSISTESLAYIENGIGSTMSNSRAFYDQNGISEATLREYYMGLERKQQLFLTLYGEGGEFAVSESELKGYFSEYFAKIDVLLILKPTTVPEGETKTVDELTADYKADAEAYLARLKAGEEIEVLAHEWELKQAGENAAADDHTHQKGDFAVVITEAARSSYGDAITDAALKAAIGETAMVEDEYFFAVFKKQDILADSEAMENYRSTALQEAKYEEYEAKIAELAAATQIETNAAAISYYKPGRIKFE